MLLGDILVARGLIQAAHIEKALEHQKQNGGRLGDNLVAIGALTAEQLNEVLNDAPAAPKDVADTGISLGELMRLVIKGMQANNLETPSQLASLTKLPTSVINQLLRDAEERKLIAALGSADGSTTKEMRYALSEAGRKLAAESMAQNRYVGPAPVSLSAFQDRILMQRITNEIVSQEDIEKSFADLTVPPDFIKRLGPGINSGRAMLLYGPAGNGKTTVAEKIGAIFDNVVYIPHCFNVEGQIIKVFDPAIHKEVARSSGDEVRPKGLRREEIDRRWVACHRPVVITGGELTLEMLDLSFNALAKFYEAPLHVKALSGTFIIDDFGRQLVNPEDLLNRWIVPLQSRVDYLKLHTGATFQIPFDELIIFSTNLHPKDLMDPAFLRRIPYKLETMEPSEADFRDVFTKVAKAQGLEMTDSIMNMVVKELKEVQKVHLAYFQPGFIVDQVVSACKYEGIAPAFSEEKVEYAMKNLFVSDSGIRKEPTAANS